MPIAEIWLKIYGLWNVPTTLKLNLRRCVRDPFTIEIRGLEFRFMEWHVLYVQCSRAQRGQTT